MKIPYALIPVILACITSFSASMGTPRELVSYSYNINGDDWNGTCQEGRQQSPIDIYPIGEGCNTDMQVHVGFQKDTQNITLVNRGYTIQANGNFSALLARNVDDVLATFQSFQFHIHAPSEHLVYGKSYDLELHIVHRLKNDSLHYFHHELGERRFAVLGLLFEVDDSVGPNPFIDALHFEELGRPRSVDLVDLLGKQIPSPLNYFTYKGSLTTPNCDEIVNWFVVEQPLKIRSDQLALITQHYAGNMTFAGGKGNNRNVRPLDGRIVRRGGVACVEQLNYLYVYLGLYVAFNLSIMVMVKLTWRNRKKVQDITTQKLSADQANKDETTNNVSENVSLPVKDVSMNVTLPIKE